MKPAKIAMIFLFSILLFACNKTSTPLKKAHATTSTNIDIPIEIREYVEKLYSDNVLEMIEGIRELGSMGEGAKSAIPFLLGCLGEQHTYVYDQLGRTTPYEEALLQLEKIDPNWRENELTKQAIPDFIAALDSEDPRDKASAINILKEIRDPRAVEPLISLLKAEHKNVIIEPNVFDNPNPPTSGPIFDSREMLVGPLIIALGEFKDPRAIEPLIAHTKKNVYPGLEFRALSKIDPNWAIKKSADELVSGYLAKIEEGKSDGKFDREKLSAVKMLALMKDARVVDAFITVLKDENVEVRKEAAKALGELKDPRAVEPLLAAFNDKSKMNQMLGLAISRALASIKDTSAIEPLLNKLKDLDDKEKILFHSSILSTLTQLGDDHRINETLKASLKDSSTSIRRNALRMLAERKDPEAFDLLVVGLNDLDSETQSKAAKALGDMNDPKAVDPLIAALNSSSKWSDDRKFRLALIDALLRLKDPRGVSVLIGVAMTTFENSESIAITKGLGEIETELAIKPLIKEIVSDASKGEKMGSKYAFELLEGIKDRKQAAELIINDEYINSQTNDIVKDLKALALGTLRDQRATERLIEILKGPRSKRFRRHAAMLLGELNDPRAFEPLVAATNDKEWFIKGAAFEALVKLKDPRSIDIFVEALNNQSANKENVVKALGDLKDPKSVDPLTGLLSSRSKGLQLAAAKALVKIDPNWKKNSTVKKILSNSSKINVHIGHCGRYRDPRLANKKSYIALVKKSAVKAKEAESKEGYKEEINPVYSLIEGLKDKDPKVRVESAEKLGTLKDSNALEPLLAAMDDSDFEVQIAAIMALAKLKDGRAIKPILKAIISPPAAGLDPKMQKMRGMKLMLLAESLERIDKNWARRKEVIDEVSAIIKNLKKSDEITKRIFSTMLVRTRDPRAVDMLIDLLKDDSKEVKLMVIDRLKFLKDKRSGTLYKRSIKPLISIATDDQDKEVRRAALDVLVRMSSKIGGEIIKPEEIKALKASLKEKYPKEHKGPLTVEEVIQVLKSEDRYVRKKAFREFRRLKDPRLIAPAIASLNIKGGGSEGWYDVYSALNSLNRAWKESGANKTWQKCKEFEEAAPKLAADFIATIEDKEAHFFDKKNAIKGLGMLKHKSAVEPLINFLKSENIPKGMADVRDDAAEALGEIGDPRAVEPLITVLHDSHTGVHSKAAVALGKIKDPRAIKPLIDTLKDAPNRAPYVNGGILIRDEYKYLQEKAAEGLQMITGEKFGTGHKFWEEWWTINKGKYIIEKPK